MIVNGTAFIGDFIYNPGQRDPEIALNQIENTASGAFKFDRNVDKVFGAAVFNEARLVVIDIDPDANIISGEIDRLFVDDLGFTVDWTLNIRYVVSEPGGTQCYNRIMIVERNTPKFGNVFGTLNEIIKANIEMAFSDPNFVQCIN